MSTDIARENRLKDRLEELKKLSLVDEGVCVSEGIDNKEGLAPWTWGWFGGGKEKVAPEAQEELQKREAAVQTREENVKLREEYVKSEDKALKERQTQYARIEKLLYQQREQQHREIEARLEALDKKERENGKISFDNLRMFRHLYKDTLRKILIEGEHDRCTLPKFLTDWFVYNWDGCGSVWRIQYELQLSKEFKLKPMGENKNQMDIIKVDVRPGSQRVVIFYIKSKLHDYMKRGDLNERDALNKLHKNTDYDDKFPDTLESGDTIDSENIDLGVLPGQTWA